MSPVVSGQAVPDAALYEPKKPGPHHLVILSTSGTAYYDWNEKIPNDWLSLSVSGIELVVVISPERKITHGTQSYTEYSYDSHNTLNIKNVDFTAYRYEADLEIREAHSGRTLATSTFKGSDPLPFPPSNPSSIELEGSHLTYADLEDWVCHEIPQECWMPLRTLKGPRDPIKAMALSPDGQTLSVVNRFSVELLQLFDGSILNTLEVDETWNVDTIATSLEGQIIASLWQYEDAIHIWQVSDNSLLQTISSPDVISLAFSPDGKMLASGSFDSSLRLWRVSDGALLRILDEPTSWRADWISSIAFSADGQTMASAAEYARIRLWRVSDGVLINEFKGYEGEDNVKLRNVALSPDGQILASGSKFGTLQLWRVSDGALLHTIESQSKTNNKWSNSDPEGHTSLAFSPNGDTLAFSWINEVYLWRVSDGALLRTLLANEGNVRLLSFSLDGHALAAVLDDGRVQLWGLQ